jgi:hypothetical protein
VFIVGTMWLGGKSFSTSPPVVIMFPDAGTPKRGSPVRVSGVSMGTVASIVEDVGKVRVGLSLSDQIGPKADSPRGCRRSGWSAMWWSTSIPARRRSRSGTG